VYNFNFFKLLVFTCAKVDDTHESSQGESESL